MRGFRLRTDGPHGRRLRLLAAAILALCYALSANSQDSTASLMNQKAPVFTRRELNGQSINLASLRGKVVLLNFWATWCSPCQTEMPVFARWQQQYRSQGFSVVGISMDDEDMPVRKLVAKLKIDYPIAMGDATLGMRYGGVLGLPLTFLIDRSGVIRAQFQGDADLGQIDESLKTLLAAR